MKNNKKSHKIKITGALTLVILFLPKIHNTIDAAGSTALNLTGSKAAGANVHSLLSAVYANSNFLDIGIPDSV